MSKRKNAVLVPQSQLTDAELEQVAGGNIGVLTINAGPPPIDPNPPERGMTRNQGNVYPGMAALRFPALSGDGCGTSDSGAMGCPG